MNKEETVKVICENIKLVKEGKLKKRSFPYTHTRLNTECPVCGYDYSKVEITDWQMEKLGNSEAYQQGTVAWGESSPYLVSCLWCSTWLICDGTNLMQTTFTEKKNDITITTSDAGKWKVTPILPYEPSGLKTPRKT
jgi:hypothetical protein